MQMAFLTARWANLVLFNHGMPRPLIAHTASCLYNEPYVTSPTASRTTDRRRGAAA